MLSYQHLYHAGNAADVHKHAALALALDHMVQKPKPLSYIETHAGRGRYDLSAPEAVKTGEAAQGIARLRDGFAKDHPYLKALKAQPDGLYPGSPAIAQALLRPEDSLHLAELHPQEHAALREALRAPNTHIYQQDGLALAQSLCPPTPRRGLMLVDPSYEIKADYAQIPKWLAALIRKWNVGVVMIWYPILTSGAHRPMLRALQADHPEALTHEVRFPPARDGHRMVGSGLFVVNPPFGLEAGLKPLAAAFRRLT
ncbi:MULTISPECIES: 23S rRNA (adenine(2030)-N(6))-methyltransferase RlmJ [Marivita]|uniref:Ribosomal RNA large subunit methyltransferase J n=1 Tax=Marivita cryptomonadis TaxID=505252 RepID=A0A9Q2P8P5_9RHOB|nr:MULTISPECIES: 23S rRNA (adenine(2030)-N(6))-methyltransferase RlmJ [Marivita]MCR9168996.1 23S rRNA (adenine(2030)-N(6))-methyltransferase RlmJ [Paracoccaceae bacterium]MBM2320369.1 23S rRNA (adenine(2030)-N(6))-methyltransferase RlmJ [Marivita cryptomonadis]MBM2329949.1 23S rRNA (adenine(2030)-N(6))-methyltransferase RlmJ [Marivita cryptomonadis]MBM2339536.1 23S rRNA (adenine(2030)-N(6))-methyltransferase RlmJ [Marivita cryptomonadis]MBM2344195.1 23S rRNA (adenine(2030)-N(6))-methyltransfer